MLPRRLCLTALVLLTLVLTARADNPLQRKSRDAPFAGRFEGDGVVLVLEFDARAGKYSGELIIDGDLYPCTATAKGTKLSGSFKEDGETFAFDATLDGDRLTLKSEGETETLVRADGREAGDPPPEERVDEDPPQQNPQQNPGRDGNQQQPPADGDLSGGVGIQFEPRGKDLVIKSVMPGGPAEKAKLPPGAILRGVDGVPLEQIPPDQLVNRIRGKPGSIVRLTFETPEEILEVILERAALPQQPDNRAPPPDDRRGQAPDDRRGQAPPAVRNGDDRAGQAQNAPLGVMRPGLRVTYYQGSSSIPGARSVLVQDPNGNWVDPQTGQRYAQADNPSSAGAGYLQLNVLAADGRDIAVDGRNYILIDPQNDQSVFTHSVAYVGTPDGLGDFWQPPAKLANTRETNEGGLRINRLQYPVNGRTYNAIAFTTTTQAGYFRNVYDLETGLLISGSSSTIGSPQIAPNPNGTASQTAGVTIITSTRILDVREPRLPWSGQQLPNWMRNGGRLVYSGQYLNLIEGAPVLPWRLDAAVTFGETRATWTPGKQSSRLDYGTGGAPQESATDRNFGATQVDPLWIDPQILASLRPGTVLDEDRTVKRRLTFAGQQGGLAVIVEEGPFEQNQFGYDPRTGVLSGIVTQQRQGVATIRSELRLANGP